MRILTNEPEVYRYQGNYYRRLDEIQYKNPLTREWEIVVLYEGIDGFYTRDVLEFYDRFTEVHGPELDRAQSLLHGADIQNSMRFLDDRRHVQD